MFQFGTPVTVTFYEKGNDMAQEPKGIRPSHLSEDQVVIRGERKQTEPTQVEKSMMRKRTVPRLVINRVMDNGTTLQTNYPHARNVPCPCKSGKKFKRCCMQKGTNNGQTKTQTPK